MSDDLYRLIPEEGKHLADSKDTEGAYRGVYLDDETNKPCGAGEFVKVDAEEYSYEEESDEVGAAVGVAALIGFGIAVGAVIVKAYPRVKTWVVDSAVPKAKTFWRKMLKKEEMEERTQLPETVDTIKSSDSSVLSMDMVFSEYRENMSSEEAQRELIEAFILYLASAQKLSRVANANIVDTEGRILDEKSLIKMVTEEQLLESVNSIIRSNPALLSPQQVIILSDVLGYSVFSEREYAPITAKALEEGLMRSLDE